uniref:uncharacterized protein LOC120337146 n=1 Tax=Styela clava TaxID=7725 RepID=UPI001939EF65|nr:uncharacterized protein LOC120337146 [Styela clava]
MELATSNNKTNVLSVASNVDLRDRIVGDYVLDWSKDNCIAVATSKNVMLYDLNPLYDVNSSEMCFKIQAISPIESLDYDAGARKMMYDYDMLCAVPSKNSAYPDFEIYRMHMDLSINRSHGSEEVGDMGFRAVQFSPLGCAVGSGTVLATLTMGHQLQLFSKSSDGIFVQWNNIRNLTEILVKILLKNEQYYPKIKFPTQKLKSQNIVEKQYAPCIVCMEWWDKIYIKSSNGKFIFLATGTKNNFVIIWKLHLPISSTSVVTIVSYIKTNLKGIKSISWLKIGSNEEEILKLAIGGIEGVVNCLEIDLDGNLLKENEVWNDRDQLTVSAIDWRETDEGDDTGLLVAKGPLLLYMKISSDLVLVSHSVLIGLHILPVVNIQFVDQPASWLTISRDGRQAKVVLKKSTEENLRLKYEVLSEQTNQSSMVFHETTHYHILSPNGAFVANLRSKPKVSLSILVENSAYLEILTLKSGMECFQSLCAQVEQNNAEEKMKLDLVESIRLHLINKCVFKNESDSILLRTCLERFLDFDDAESNKLRLTWILLKIYSAVFSEGGQDYSKKILQNEKILSSKQMMKVIKHWFINSNDEKTETHQIPIKTIINWLSKNKNILSEDDFSFVEKVRTSKNYELVKKETCPITREFLTMSEDAKSAITESKSMTWFRCCLTFCALHCFKARKCEISNSRALNLNDSGNEEECAINDLLQDCSIYSGLPMI